MPKTISDSTGSEIEVFTAEELETQKNEAIDQYKKDNPDKSEEIDSLQKDLATAKEELEKLGKKDLNFANLRQQKEAAETKVESLKKEIDDKIALAKKEILEGVMKDHYNEIMKSLAGDDEELKKKIEFHYNRIQDVPTTKEEINKKLRDAWTLATKVEEASALNATVISSGGVSRPNVKSEKKFTPEEKDFGKKLGAAGGIELKEEDFK